MSAMKHEGFTPGPWKVRKMRSHIAIESALVRVADVRAARGPGHDSEADATLLADAPALLAENERLRTLLTEASSPALFAENCRLRHVLAYVYIGLGGGPNGNRILDASWRLSTLDAIGAALKVTP